MPKTKSSIQTSSTIGRRSSRNFHQCVSFCENHMRLTFGVQRDGTKITSFEACNFRPMFEFFELEKARKKALSAAEKKEIKKQKDDAEAKYTFCLLDGRKEKIGNFRVEPTGLFRGRGEHPKKGALKVIIPSVPTLFFC